MIRVYHNTNAVIGETYISFFKDEFITVPESQLGLVAEVESDDLQTAYNLTNTKEKDWWTNKLVNRKFGERDCRSTSVGDVLELNGTYYAVAPFGFKPVQIVPS